MAKVSVGIILASPFYLALSGCGGGPDSASQAVARVNGTEITIHQLNQHLVDHAFQAQGDSGRDALDTLIDQELLVQQAVNGGLERDPKVMLAIEEAKRRVLALAYLERNVLPKARPTDTDIHGFYGKYPELFAQRKIYRLQVFSIPADQFDAGLKQQLDRVRGPEETVHILKARNIGYRSDWLQWSAEQAPLELLPRLAGMAPGDIAAVPRGGEVWLMQLETALPAPVDENKAREAIEAYLASARNDAASRKKLDGLWGASEIEYLGAFSGSKPRPAEDAPTTRKDLASSGGSHLQKGIDGL